MIRGTPERPARRESEALQVLTAQLDRKDHREQRAPPVKKVILVLKDLKDLKAIKAIQVRRAMQGQRETQVLPERLALTVKVLTPLLRLAATRTLKLISTQTLPLCRGLRRHLRLYKETDT